MPQLSTIQELSVIVLPILFAITLHEVAHGWMALKCGDKTALMLGRLTLNPVKHIDPIGTIVVPILLFFFGGFIFGWAKPVPVTWENLRHPKRDMALVAFAGPVANLLMALFWALVGKLGVYLYSQGIMPEPSLALVLMGRAGILINLVIMILNLLPIPPLDGSRVIASLLKGRLAWYYYRMEPYGFIILLVLIATNIVAMIMGPPIFILTKWISAIFGLPFPGVL